MKKELKTTEKRIQGILCELRKEEDKRPHSFLGAEPSFTRFMERRNLRSILGEELFGIIAERWSLGGHDESEILPVSYARDQFLTMIGGGEIKIVSEADLRREYGIDDYMNFWPCSRDWFVMHRKEEEKYENNFD